MSSLTISNQVSSSRLKAVAIMAALFITICAFAPVAHAKTSSREHSAELEVFTPRNGDFAGVGGKGFFVDLRARFDGDLASTGVSIRTAPPGGAGAAPDFPGLVVLLSSSTVGAGAGQNLANLFNIIGVTDRDETLAKDTEVWATWVIAAPKFGNAGTLTKSRLLVAIVDGRAPSVVTDQNGDGVIDEKDLEALGFHIISDVVKRHFTVNGF
jgi:hypothetical protein